MYYVCIVTIFVRLKFKKIVYPKSVIPLKSTQRLYWDNLIICIISYSVYAIPYELAFIELRKNTFGLEVPIVL